MLVYFQRDRNVRELVRIEELLAARGIAFKRLDVTGDQPMTEFVTRAAKCERDELPVVFVSDRAIGPFPALVEADVSGELARLVAASAPRATRARARCLRRSIRALASLRHVPRTRPDSSVLEHECLQRLRNGIDQPRVRDTFASVRSASSGLVDPASTAQHLAHPIGRGARRRRRPEARACASGANRPSPERRRLRASEAPARRG